MPTRAGDVTGVEAREVSINLAGPLTLSAEPGRIGPSDFPGRQGRLVFAHLLLAGRPVDRDELAQMLWPDGLPSSWSGDLSAVVSKLRALLAPIAPGADLGGRELIAGGRGWYELRRPARWHVDVQEADRVLAGGDRADVARLDEVIATARRPFLPGDECGWVDDRRSEQRERLRRALGQRAELLRRRADPEAVVAARELVELEPDREDAHLAVVGAHLATGDPVGALRAYEHLRRHLRDELGLVPSPSAVALQQQALGGSDGRQAPPVPAPPLIAETELLPFVGRVAELDRVLGYVASDTTRLVIVTGEPGAGKTRLATEAARRVHATGGPVLFGRGDGTGDPYGAWVEALGHWLCAPGANEVLGRLPADVADRLGRLVPGVGPSNDLEVRRTGSEVEPGERSLLHAAVVYLLEAARRPLLVVLDDLHRTDGASFLLLEHVVRCPALLTVLTTARHPEITEAPLRDVVARLRRDDLMTSMALGGLSAPDMGALIDAVTEPGTATRYPGLIASLHDATAGNPLYVRELARHLALTGHLDEDASPSSLLEVAGLPPGLDELIDANLARLGADVRRLLEVAALIGTEFQLDVLAPVCDQPAAHLLSALETATRAGVLIESTPAGSFRFSHPLVREVLVLSVSRTRQAQLHERVATVMERSAHTDRSPVALAQHVLAAGALRSEAVMSLRRAGHRAVNVFAFEEAARWYERAVEVAEATGTDRVTQAGLLLAVGDAHNRAGDVPSAREPLRRAIRLAREERASERFAEAVLGFGRLLVDEGYEGGTVNRELVDLLLEARDALPSRPSSLRSRVLARLAVELHFAGDRARCLELAQTARAEAQACDDPLALATALGANHFALYGSPHVHERLALLDEIAALNDHDRPTARPLRDYFELGDLGASDASISAFERRIERGGIASDRYYPALWRATRAAFRGRFDEAEAAAEEALVVGRSSGRGPTAVTAVHGVQVFVLALFRGSLDALVPAIETVADANPERPVWRAAAAFSHLELGAARAASRHLDVLGAPGFARLPATSDLPLALALCAWTAAEVGSTEDCRELLDLLLPYEDLLVVVGTTPAACAGPATHPLAAVAARLGDRTSAERWFQAAERTDRRLGATPWLARAQVDHARFLARGDDPDRGRARSLAADASDLARRLGMGRVRQRADALLSSYRLAR